MPTASVSEKEVPDKVGGIVHDALVTALNEQGLDVPPNELQNIKNLVEEQAGALAEELADEAAQQEAEDYLASDEFGQSDETTTRKAPAREEQEGAPTEEEGGEVEEETTRERTSEETEPAEKPTTPVPGAQGEAAATAPPPTLPTGIHAEMSERPPEGEQQEGAIEGQEPKEAASPEIAEAQSAEKEQETAPEQPPQKEAAKEAPKTTPQEGTPQSKKPQQPQPTAPQGEQPKEEQVPGAPSGDITPPEGTPGESKEKEKQEAPKQEGAPESEEQKATETKKAQQQARIQQGAEQTGEIAEAEKELKTLTDKARQFGPSLGKILIPVASAVQEFLPLLDTGFIAGLVSIVTTVSKALWFISQGSHLKEFVWKKARARFAISSIIEIVPWLNWIPSALLTDVFTLKNIRDEGKEVKTKINALTAKIKKLGARR